MVRQILIALALTPVVIVWFMCMAEFIKILWEMLHD